MKEECATQFTFMQVLESIVSNEFPHIKFALKVDTYIIIYFFSTQHVHCNDHHDFGDVIIVTYLLFCNYFYNNFVNLLCNTEYFWNELVLNM